MGTLYINDVRAHIASILESSAATTALNPSGSPSAEGVGATRRYQTRQQEGSHNNPLNLPSQHGGGGSGLFESTTPLSGAALYPVSTSCGKPLVTPRRGSSPNRSGEGAKSARRSTEAALLALQEPNVPTATSPSPAVPLLGESAVGVTLTSLKQRHRLLSPTMTTSRRRSPNGDGAQGVGKPSAGRTNSTFSTAVGGSYAIHVCRHPLYSGRGAPQRGRTSPPLAADKATGVQGGLSISVEANTVRRLQRSVRGKPTASVAVTKAAPAKAVTASDVCAMVRTGQTRLPGRRGSVIEQLAAATQLKISDGPSVGQAAYHPHANTAGSRDSKHLGPLQLHDVMCMRLQEPPSNVSARRTNEVDRRLPNDTLVLAAPERMQNGEESPTYTHLKAFQMPHKCTAAPVAGISTSEVSPLPSGADTLYPATLAGATAAGAAPPPPPPPPAVPAVAGADDIPAASAAETRMNVSTAATIFGAPFSAQPLSARGLRKEEVAEAGDMRLLGDLIAASHHDHQSARPTMAADGGESGTALLPASRSHMSLFDSATTSTGPTTAADFTAAMAIGLQLQRVTGDSPPVGWWKPPANVLLPDPTQSVPTWTVHKSASAQEAQQAAAMAASARPTGGAGVNHSASRANDLTAAAPDTVDGAAGGDGMPRMSDCIDYHAPFQCVLCPEYAENDLVPAALNAGAAVDTGVDDLMTSRHTHYATTGIAAGATVEQRDGVNMDALATGAAVNSGTTLKPLAAQAVILRDPLSLLACEHLAEDTVDVTARRRAYLSAMNAMHGITHGSALFTARPGTLTSMLQEASPPSVVFCKLSYPAKILLSAILYMRALGALPSLLRVGPLTEYSPIVDKENCIELVFHNPSGEEGDEQATQEQQLMPSQYRSAREGTAGSTVAHREAPAARTSLIEAVTPTNARERAHSLPLTARHPISNPGTLLRNRSRSQSGNTAHGFTGGTFAKEGATQASRGHNYTDASPTQPQQRLSVIEARLMKTLSATSVRRASSLTSQSFNTAPSTARTVSPHRLFSRASFTSLAGPPLHSAEFSVVVDGTPDEVLSLPGTGGGKMWRSENGARLPRNASRNRSVPHGFARRIGGRGTNAVENLSGNDNVLRVYADPTSGRQRRQRPSKSPPKPLRHGSERASAAIRHVPRVCTTPPLGTPTSSASGEVSSTAATTATVTPGLRRSSFIVALEDLQQATQEGGVSAVARGANTPLPPPHSPSGCTESLLSAPQPTKVMPPSPTHFKANGSTATRGRGAEAAPASGAKPASAYGPGATRFLKGEQELCVVLRAVVAQKSHVYSFGKAETVHVLPPLPRRSADRDNSKALLRKQTMQKMEELERIAAGPSNPLFKLLCGSTKLWGGAKIEADQWKAALLDRARRAAAAMRQHRPVMVNEHNMPVVDDYGDLVVAFLLSGNASELSGSVPDMMELEALRYRIFSLRGYSVNDPAGMQAVREAAAVGGASTADRARLQQDSASFTAFQTSVSPHPPAGETSFGATCASPRGSIMGVQRRPSFFEAALRPSDPLADLANGDGGRGLYLTEFDIQQLQKKQQQQVQPQDMQALIQRRYPIYRASSVAESTLQDFFAEAKATVAAAHQRGRRRGGAKPSNGHRSTSGGRSSSPSSLLDHLARHTHADAAAAALQDVERDLLRFRPMNLNSFHRELTDAVQCALDLQIWQGKENVLQAFHM
ncbi:hypothetical protein MNV84_04705 [Leishmania braziliensis]|nr:hypothetical protein MNV84_04705 [Leishmania braziliensis]